MTNVNKEAHISSRIKTFFHRNLDRVIDTYTYMLMLKWLNIYMYNYTITMATSTCIVNQSMPVGYFFLTESGM